MCILVILIGYGPCLNTNLTLGSSGQVKYNQLMEFIKILSYMHIYSLHFIFCRSPYRLPNMVQPGKNQDVDQHVTPVNHMPTLLDLPLMPLQVPLPPSASNFLNQNHFPFTPSHNNC